VGYTRCLDPRWPVDDGPTPAGRATAEQLDLNDECHDDDFIRVSRALWVQGEWHPPTADPIRFISTIIGHPKRTSNAFTHPRRHYSYLIDSLSNEPTKRSCPCPPLSVLGRSSSARVSPLHSQDNAPLGLSPTSASLDMASHKAGSRATLIASLACSLPRTIPWSGFPSSARQHWPRTRSPWLYPPSPRPLPAGEGELVV
jgi:hypothetical protein